MSNALVDPIKDGTIDFRTFLLRCARLMGPLSVMRDMPQDALIPDLFEAGTYHADKAAESEAELAEVLAMTDEQAEAEATRQYEEVKELQRQSRARKDQALVSYNKMLSKVQAWTPESDQYQPLKDFMVQQLLDNITVDCEGSDYEIRQIAGPAWREAQANRLRDHIEYQKKEQAGSEALAQWRTEWVRGLKARLPEAGS